MSEKNNKDDIPVIKIEPLEVKDGSKGVNICQSHDGGPNEEAFGEIKSEDLPEVMKNRCEHPVHRYILRRPEENITSECCEGDSSVKDECCEGDSSVKDECCVGDSSVELPVLPSGFSNEEICPFFEDEPLIQATSRKYAEKALEQREEKISHRDIKISPSTTEQIRNEPRGGGMRGGSGSFIGPGGLGNLSTMTAPTDDAGPNFNDGCGTRPKDRGFNNNNMGGGGGFGGGLGDRIVL
ncbi:heterogeneous nuclear ribonucleoprotein H2 [Hyalella azteca]|uniref:Heterogeneous nuclear ribonucleoprotein H2 n=1 Tax=Hyalella azteca TaxID=294128 RepID=A0A8B7P2Q7_HYAAZ|nr:heterogeneous nuclear ribonucleoprotein H2 [Hyalella azteca]